MLEAYVRHVHARAEEGLPPLALNADQTGGLVELLK
ncbi:aconitase B, partial [Pseudomonas sp. GM78]